MKTRHIKERFKSLSLFKKIAVILLASLTAFFAAILVFLSTTIYFPIVSYKLTGKPEWAGQELIIKGYNDCGEKAHSRD